MASSTTNPVPQYDRLTSGYVGAQRRRIAAALDRLDGGDPALRAGRVVPGDDALVIGAGRRLDMAVLFLDISGFSARPAETAAEQHAVLQTLNLFFTEMVRVAEDYGGTVEKNTGDGLMAYFEDRSAGPGERGAARALAAALTMMHVNDAELSPVLASAGVAPVSFRVAIDHGPVTIARLGAARRFNANVAIGTTANIASKLLAKAAPGEVLVGESVIAELPVEWTQWLEVKDASGFAYRADGRPYLAYCYRGRWVSPAGGTS